MSADAHHTPSSSRSRVYGTCTTWLTKLILADHLELADEGLDRGGQLGEAVLAGGHHRAGERDRADGDVQRCGHAHPVDHPIGRREQVVYRSSAAAPPPTALNRLTSCGIAVICTLRAAYGPDRAADAPPQTRTSQPVPVIDPSSTRATTVALLRLLLLLVQRTGVAALAAVADCARH